MGCRRQTFHLKSSKTWLTFRSTLYIKNESRNHKGTFSTTEFQKGWSWDSKIDFPCDEYLCSIERALKTWILSRNVRKFWWKFPFCTKTLYKFRKWKIFVQVSKCSQHPFQTMKLFLGQKVIEYKIHLWKFYKTLTKICK